jgi:hypothetical protein
MAMVEPSVLAEFLRLTNGGAGGGDVDDAPRRSSHGSDILSVDGPSISAGQIMDLLSSRGVNWRDSAAAYFRTTHMWLSAIHCPSFNTKVALFDLDDRPTDVQMALLLVCMHLTTEPTRITDAGEVMPMLKRPLYVIARRIFALIKSFERSSIELIQCGVLLSLYEYGHGDIARGYTTLGEATTMANALRIKPGKYVDEERDSPVDADEEERRSLYWGLFILDKSGSHILGSKTGENGCNSCLVLTRYRRLTHEECTTMWAPIQIDPPADDDLLPTEINLWDKDTQSYVTSIQRLPCSTPPTVPVGSFQRACQAGILLSWALAYEAENRGKPFSQRIESFFELDAATRSFVEAMIFQPCRWGEFCESFSMCVR